MKHTDALDTAAAVLLLLAALAAMVVPVAVLCPQWLIPPLVLAVIALCVLLFLRRRLRAYVAGELCSTEFDNSRIQYSLAGLPIPTMLVSNGRILWYNDAFHEKVLGGADVVTRAVERVFPELELAVCSRPHGQDIAVGQRRFTA